MEESSNQVGNIVNLVTEVASISVDGEHGKQPGVQEFSNSDFVGVLEELAKTMPAKPFATQQEIMNLSWTKKCVAEFFVDLENNDGFCHLVIFGSYPRAKDNYQIAHDVVYLKSEDNQNYGIITSGSVKNMANFLKSASFEKIYTRSNLKK